MNFKNIFFSLIGIAIIIVACNTYEDTVCSVCDEQTVHYTTKICGTENKVSDFEYNICLAGDSVQFQDTLRAGDSIFYEEYVDEVTISYYLDTLFWDTLHDGWNVDYEYEDSISIWVYYCEDSGGYVSWYEDVIDTAIDYKFKTNYDDDDESLNDSIFFIYRDSIRIDSYYIWEIVYTVPRFEYLEPIIDGDVTYSSFDNTDTAFLVTYETPIDTVDWGEDVQVDTSTYRKYFQQDWKCTRQ